MRSRNLLTLFLVVALVACGNSASTDSSKGNSSDNKSAVLVHPLSGRDTSPTSVLAVKVDDTEPAHPQIGLASADVETAVSSTAQKIAMINRMVFSLLWTVKAAF